MSLALTHFLVGATIAVWAVTFESDNYDNDETWWMYVGGLFAMLPDVSKFLPILEPLHDNLIASSFFFLHGLLDVVDPTDSIYVAGSMVALFGISVLLTRWHGLR